MNETRKQKVASVLSILVSVSAIIYNIVRIWKIFRDNERQQEEHVVNMKCESARLEECLSRLQGFNKEEKKAKKYTEEYKRDHKFCSVCKFSHGYEYDDDRCQQCWNDNDRTLFVYKET